MTTDQLHQGLGYDCILILIEETLRFLDDEIGNGKIVYYGFSNFLGWQLTKVV